MLSYAKILWQWFVISIVECAIKLPVQPTHQLLSSKLLLWRKSNILGVYMYVAVNDF